MKNYKSFVITLIVMLLGACSQAVDKQKPNIVLIMADDVSWEAFGCYGALDYKTPNLDRMAGVGVRFTHCYSTPICTPSRVMIMTGKYNFRNYTHFGYLNPAEKTFGHLMKDAGYKTAIAGKWQLNGLYNKDLFTDHNDNTRPHKAGFDEYCLWQLTKGKSQGERFWSPLLEQNGQLLSSKDNQDIYGPDILCDFICDFMDCNQDKPFFVYYPMVLVHDPFVPTPDTIGDADRSHKANKPPKDAALKKANFVAMVSYMDKIVGRILDKLEAIGQSENTLVIFTADNGTHKSIKSQWKGRTIKGGKGELKDMGTHVPLIAWWKGHTPKGAVIDDLVDFTDVYPTLAEVAGVKLTSKDPFDGQSFYPQLLGRPTVPRQWVLCHYQPYWGPKPGLFVRDSQFKLYGDGRFYDVPSDLDEEHDLAGHVSDPSAQASYEQLQDLIKQCPPVPVGKGNRDVDRPIHPDWPKISLSEKQLDSHKK